MSVNGWVDRSVGRLPGRLLVQSVSGCMGGRLAHGWLVGRSGGWSVGQLSGWSISPLVVWSVSWLVRRSVDGSVALKLLSPNGKRSVGRSVG